MASIYPENFLHCVRYQGLVQLQCPTVWPCLRKSISFFLYSGQERSANDSGSAGHFFKKKNGGLTFNKFVKCVIVMFVKVVLHIYE